MEVQRSTSDCHGRYRKSDKNCKLFKREGHQDHRWWVTNVSKKGEIGSGVKSSNIKELCRDTKAVFYHGSASVTVQSDVSPIAFIRIKIIRYLQLHSPWVRLKLR